MKPFQADRKQNNDKHCLVWSAMQAKRGQAEPPSDITDESCSLAELKAYRTEQSIH